MNTTYILDAVKQEIARLQQVAELLESPTSMSKIPAHATNRKGHRWTAKQRAEMSAKLRANGAARKKKKKGSK